MSRLEQVGVWAGIIGAIAGVIALWPIFFPPSPSPEPPPQIPDYSSGWVDGGKSTPDYCNPQKAALEKKYPNYRIEMTYLAERHDDNRDKFGFKHDRYMYGCSFSAHPK